MRFFNRREYLLPLSLFLFILIGSTVFNVKSLLFSLSPQMKINENNIYELYDRGAQFAVYDNKKLEIPDYIKSLYFGEEGVLGETAGDKRIEIDLTNQRLYGYEGSNRVFNFLISSGKWGRTPTGSFKVWIKLRATKMSGGSKALGTYYYLPNVPYVMYFYNSSIPRSRGYGIHGTYWHNNFGHPMSHGCINMRTEEAAQVYNWAYVGIPVIIYGTTPAS